MPLLSSAGLPSARSNLLRAIQAWAFALALAVLAPASALGQLAGPDGDGAAAAGAEREKADDGGIWKGFWGEPEPNRIYAGLWALHLYRRHDGFSAHHLLGLNRGGWIGSTFVNSHGGRTWTVGVARTVAALGGQDGEISFGYRAGIIRGYDERLGDVAERWPVIPGAELTMAVRYRSIGAHVNYVYYITSVGFFLQL